MAEQCSPGNQGRRLLALLLLLVLWLSIGARVSVAAVAAHDQQQHDAASLYGAAKDYYYQLERDPSLGRERKNWLNGVRRFRRIYLAQTKGSLAPSALYMMGRMQFKMYQQFKLPMDLDESIGYYQDVAAIFPNNTLADDALFTTGEIFLNIKNNRHQAAELYQRIVRHYGEGDRYTQALTRLNELERKHHIQIPRPLAAKRDLSQRVSVLPVKYWSSTDYTRVVIRASAAVHFSSGLLPARPGQPQRLFIDFKQSYIPPQYRSPVPIEDGLLQQIRSGQHTDNTVRVVLDMASIADYKVFSLNDPFRVVVDVHGRPDQKKIPANLASASASRKARLAAAARRQAVRPQAAAVKRPASAHPFISLHDQKKRRPLPGSGQGKNTLSLAQQLGLGVRRIVIDPGHGGKDPGAMGHGLKEKNLVLAISRKIGEILRSSYGYEVILTRASDIFIPLEERTAIANTRNGDLFISVHVNAHPDKTIGGIETYYLNLATNAEAMRVAALENATSTHNISELQDILASLMQNSKINESSRLAQAVHGKVISGLAPHYPVRDLGVKQAPFYVLLGAEMPAILAEISFISNPAEARLLQSSSYQTRVARQIAAGVVAYIDQHTTAGLLP
ncbi:N-acetylmuramoyl-L-alanine amidase [Desulfogranum mediterraneum]|uniref:N-acetylmuramoyl-L-alanine amidase n=1 Tax=Desulfogranum mediterraneum TaxID=160661 RepID=UPI00041CDFDA|nr:N-acetylmuramoyl-L-alanine amidase [Desulfogranum mediterraneum]